MPDKWFNLVMEILKGSFTGCIEIHCYQGKPVKIKKIEEVKI
jgi:hypothetical protein